MSHMCQGDNFISPQDYGTHALHPLLKIHFVDYQALEVIPRLCRLQWQLQKLPFSSANGKFRICPYCLTDTESEVDKSASELKISLPAQISNSKKFQLIKITSAICFQYIALTKGILLTLATGWTYRHLCTASYGSVVAEHDIRRHVCSHFRTGKFLDFGKFHYHEFSLVAKAKDD